MPAFKLFRLYWMLVMGVFTSCFLSPSVTQAQKSQGIGTNTPNPRAVLDLTVEQPATFPQGFLLPRLTTAQRNALATVAGLPAGMAVFDSNDLKFYIWNGSWVAAGTSNITTITGTNIASVTTISGGYNINVPYVSIVGVNGLVVSGTGASFTINGQNVTQWSNTVSGIFYNSGNVAIGTNNDPTQGKLVVVEDASINPAIAISAGNITKSVNIQFARNLSSDGGIGIAGTVASFSGIATPGDMIMRAEAGSLIMSAKNAGGDIKFATGLTDTEKMRITNNGKVGIGAAPGIGSPQLIIQGNTSTSGVLFSNSLTVNSLSISGSVLTVDGVGNVGMGIITSSSPSWQLGGNSISGALSTILGTTSNSPIGFYSNGTERMIIDQFGRIGIGTTSTATSLEIAANIAGGLKVSGNTSGGTMAQIINTGTFSSPALDVQSQGSSPTIKAFNTNLSGAAGNFVVFNVNSTGAALTINSNSTTSGRALDVTGNVRLTSYITPGAVLTVDGLGNVGMGIISSSPSWQLGGNAITGGSSTILGASTNFPIGFYTNGIEQMQITSSGNVGINNPSPFFSTALDLIGYNGGPALNVLAGGSGGSPYAIKAMNNSTSTQYTIQSFNTVSGGGAALFSNSNVSGGIINPVVKIIASSTVPGYVGLEVQGGIKFDNLNNAGSVLTVDGLGNVGMGTLAMSGNVSGTRTGTNTGIAFWNGVSTITSDINFNWDINTTSLGINKLYIGNPGVDNIFLSSKRNLLTVTGAQSNVVIGTGNTGLGLTTGANNVFIGLDAGTQLSSSTDNVFIGNQAGINASGNRSLLLGYYAGRNASGSFNIFLGADNPGEDATGSRDIIIGNGAGSTIAGDYNILIGEAAGIGNMSGINNIALGRQTVILNGANNSIAVGYQTTTTGSNQIVMGNAITGLGINTAPTTMLDVNGDMRVRNLSVSGSVLTVDGLGNIGMGIMASANGTIWTLSGNNILPQNQNYTLGLGTIPGTTNKLRIYSTVNGEALLIENNNTGGGTAIHAFTNDGNGSGAAIIGENSGPGWGVFGINQSTATDAAGVYGLGGNAGSNAYYGVLGYTYSNNVAGAGVYGNNNTGGIGVKGIASGASGFGVRGEFTPVSGLGFGIYGVTNSTTTGSAAIYGSAPTGGYAAIFKGNSSVTGIQFTNSLKINSLSVSGSVLTVDGLGNVGMGTIGASTNYFTFTGSNIRALNNTDNIQLASTSGAFFIGTNTGLRMTNLNSLFLANAGNTTTTGNDNNFLGNQAGYQNTTGYLNNFLGLQAGYSNTTGNSNNFLGYQAGYSNTTGAFNNILGYNAGNSNTTGANNNFLGNAAGYFNTGGANNNFLGASAGFNNTTGAYNNFLGGSAGFNNAIGANNNFFGNAAGYSNTTGANNNFFGNSAGFNNTAGSGNIFIGTFTGFTNTTGNYNVVIGSSANVTSNNLNNAVAIGAFTSVSGSNSVSIGNNITSLGINTSAPTAMLDVNGGARIRSLSVSGSVLTVDGLGNVGMGAIAASANYWSLTGSNYVTIAPVTAVGIGTTTPTAALDVYQLNNSNVNNNGVNFNLIHQGGSGTKTGMFITYSFAGIGGTDNYRGVYLDLSGNNTGGSNINHGYYVNHNVTGVRPAMGYFANIIGTSTGNKTGMGINVSGTGGTQNIGINVTVTGATNNYAALLNGGNVGIGTSTPNQTLAVVGNTSITGISYLSSTVGIGVNTFTGFEALRIGGLNPSSPKGIVFPYITTAQMVAITAAGLGPLDAGMGFYVTEYKNVTIWDGTQFSGAGGNNNNNNNYPSYNWDIYGSVSISGTTLSTTGFGKLGTMDYSGVMLQTNSQSRMFIPASTLAGITIGVGNFSQTVTSALAVKGDIGLGDGTSTNNGNVVVWLTNSSGSALAPGTIVVVGTSDDSFNTTSTASDNSVIGVLTENCSIGNSCKVAVSGVVTVSVNGGSTRGQHCVTSVVSGQALSVPVPSAGASIGVFLQTTGGTSARVLLR